MGNEKAKKKWRAELCEKCSGEGWDPNAGPTGASCRACYGSGAVSVEVDPPPPPVDLVDRVAALEAECARINESFKAGEGVTDKRFELVASDRRETFDRLTRKLSEFEHHLSIIDHRLSSVVRRVDDVEATAVERASAMVMALADDTRRRFDAAESERKELFDRLTTLADRVDALASFLRYDFATGRRIEQTREEVEAEARASGMHFMKPVAADERLVFSFPAARAKLRVIEDVLAERIRQDGKWGGPRHDDEHGTMEWRHYIDVQLQKHIRPSRDIADRRRGYVKVAALAFAAIESIDRKTSA